ncbi:MAG: LicD family protein [Muribaculaceae bacterium]|nr:LicD family protein [Muribaculaceae bacterium]
MISPERQAELRSRFNPDGSPMRRRQLRMLEILKFIDRVCSDRGIPYWLSSGTCLGAIRHGGFIPWDDDIDIELLEPDFRRLRSAWLSLENPPFAWQDFSTDRGYVTPNPKIRDLRSEIQEPDPRGWDYRYRGLFVDVFHIRPSSSLWLDKAVNLYQKHIIWPLAAVRSHWVQRLLLRPAFNFFRCVITPAANFFARIGSHGQLRHAPGSLFTRPRRLADVQATVRVPFEGMMLPVPAGYDSYLRNMYGDYNELPATFHTHSLRVDFL